MQTVGHLQSSLNVRLSLSQLLYFKMISRELLKWAEERSAHHGLDREGLPVSSTSADDIGPEARASAVAGDDTEQEEGEPQAEIEAEAADGAEFEGADVADEYALEMDTLEGEALRALSGWRPFHGALDWRIVICLHQRCTSKKIAVRCAQRLRARC